MEGFFQGFIIINQESKVSRPSLPTVLIHPKEFIFETMDSQMSVDRNW